jgi:hypothetical protein
VSAPSSSEGQQNVVALHDPSIAGLGASVPLVTQTEIATLWEIAKGLAASKFFKDVDQSAQAFAKLVFGRDYGLTPAQSMQLYIMDGKVEVPYSMWGHFIRRRPGYDYRTEWREEGSDEWLPEETGLKEITGCRITFLVNGNSVGTSIWRKEDTERAELNRPTRSGAKSNHVKFPRNMYFARAMSNGVKMRVPEVMNGIPFYAENELPRNAGLSDGDGDGSELEWVIGGEGELTQEQVDAVEATIVRAERVQHAGIASRASAKVKLNHRPDLVEGWLAKTKRALDEIDPPDAEVVMEVDLRNVLHVVDVPALHARRFEHPKCGASWAVTPEVGMPAEGEALACAGCGEQVPVGTTRVDLDTKPPGDDESPRVTV